MTKLQKQKISFKIEIFAMITLGIMTASIFSHNDGVYGQPTSKTSMSKMVDLKITSLFKIKALENSFTLENEKKVWHNVIFEKNPKNSKIYKEIQPSKKLQKKIVVVYPLFTAVAYGKGAFYDYYKGMCNDSCLTVPIQKNYESKFESSGNAIQVLKLLGYDFITDEDVDKNPQILKKYSKIILLHNEYVTKREFDAITKHPNVVYLYPNALYAKVSVDYKKNQISLVRGHGYPDSKIGNGFGWKFDNSDFEQNTKCLKMGFDKIPNGWMLNCYPESAIHASKVLLKTIRDI